MAIAIVVEPGGAHSGAQVIHTGLCSHISKLAALILVQIVAPEIVRDVKIRPAIAVEIAPRRRKTVPVVVVVHPCARGYVLKKTSPVRHQLVTEEEIRRTILRVVV